MQLRKELVASAIARAQLDEMTKIAAQRYKAWVKERNAYVSYLRSENELSKNNSDLQKTITLNAKKQWENAKDSLSDYDKALKGMSESIDVDALVNDSNDANKKEAEEYANYMKNIESELTKTRIALIEDRRKAEIASVENTYKENINKIKGYSAKENQ